MHGRKMGTHGTGARKNKRDSGNRGGKGMAGTGKRADHKKTLVIKKYGGEYFGKKGVTSRGTKRDKRDRINVGDIQEKYKSGEVDLKNYKILGAGEVKNKLIIKAKEASKSAIKKVEKAGGEIILIKKKIVANADDKKTNKQKQKTLDKSLTAKENPEKKGKAIEIKKVKKGDGKILINKNKEELSGKPAEGREGGNTQKNK